ncbi:MAG: OstA-like protein, partial [Muribaculaceae bacterium]
MPNKKILHNHGHKVLSGFLCLLAICFLNVMLEETAWAQKKNVFAPQIPKANRLQKNKVFLEYADKLSMDENISKDYQVLTGNVKFRKEGMFMYCDSAYFYDKTNSLDAFGNVRMEQGDTL